MPGLTPERKKQLDANIQSMLANGASKMDVEKYVNDFNAKFATEELKKKDQQQVGPVPYKGAPAMPFPIGGQAGSQLPSTLPSEAEKAQKRLDSFQADFNDFNTLYSSKPEEFKSWASSAFPDIKLEDIAKEKKGSPQENVVDAYLFRIKQRYDSKLSDNILEQSRNQRANFNTDLQNSLSELGNVIGSPIQAPKTIDDIKKINDLLNKKDLPKETAQQLDGLKGSITPKLSTMVGSIVFGDMSKKGMDIEPLEIGKRVVEIMNPSLYAQYKTAGGDKRYGMWGGIGGTDKPEAADAINRTMTEIGNGILRMYGNKSAIDRSLLEEKNLKTKFTKGEQERVKNRIASELYNKGITPSSANQEQIDEVVKTLPDTDKGFWKIAQDNNNTTLPSTGFGYSLKNGYNSVVKDAVTTVLSPLIPDITRERSLSNLESAIKSDIVGENPVIASRVNELNERAKQGVITEDEKIELDSLNKQNNVTSKWDKIKNMAGSGLGQIMGLGSIAAFTGGLAEAPTVGRAALSLALPAGSRGGVSAAAYLMANESNKKQALQMFPTEPEKRFVAGEVFNAIDVLVERLFPEERVLPSSFKKEIAKDIASISTKNITQQLNENLAKTIAKKVKNFVVEAGKAPLQEVAEEEISMLLKDGVFPAITNPEFEQQGVTLDNIFRTGEQAFWGASILGAPKGFSAMANTRVPIETIWSTVSDPVQYSAITSSINDMVKKGELTKEDATQKLSLINSGVNEYRSNPVVNGQVGDMSLKKRQNYFARLMHEKSLAQQMGSTSDENAKAFYQKAIDDSKAVRERMFNNNIDVNEDNQEVPAGTAEMPAIQVQDKIEKIKAKNPFIKDTDIVKETFTPEEDAADREALPESQFKTEQELQDFLDTGEYAMLTGQNPETIPLSKEANKKLNEKAQQWLSSRGLTAIPIFGKYGNSERSFMVPNMTQQQAIEFAKEFQQDSVAHSSGMVYQDGSINPRQAGVDLSPQFNIGGDNFSTINVGGKKVDFKISYDFKNTIKPAAKMATAAERLGAEVAGDVDQKVQMAQRALDATGVKITMIDSTADFENAVAERKGPAGVEGVFISDTGEILINKELLDKGIADGRVIWHEASHPVINIVRNTNSPLFDKVIAGMKEAAKTDKAVEAVLNWANDNYGMDGEGVVNDEAVVEMIANLSEGTIDISKLPTGFKQSIIDFINKVAQALGFKPVLSDTDVAAFKKLVTQVSDALIAGRDISEIVGAENVTEIGSNIGDPTQLRKAEPKGEPVTVGTDYKLSFVKESDLIDINGLIKDIQDKGQKVWFWVADQLGRGMYYDKVIDGEHYLDAGPSYALDPENRSKNIIWASGMPKARAEKLIGESDYIFIISGSPTKSKLFNKRVAELVINRIKNVVGEDNSYAKFKKQILKVSNVSSLNSLVKDFNSFDDLLESPRRKDFLNVINDQKEKKGTDLKKLLDKYNAFVDYNELTDDFYKQNGFEQNDIMLVLKPTGVGGKSNHSTYENDILGDVVGVPDRKINSYDIMPDETRGKYGEMPRAQQSQVIAPYGVGVKKVQARKGNLVMDAGLNKQMTSDDQGNYIFYHYSDRKLKSISPSRFGKNLATGRDERPGIGISMYYTRPDILETGVPSDYGFAVRVPENKVYPFNEDPLDLLPAAEKEFNKKFPGQAFDFNKQVAFITQEAAKRGYPMTVAQWNIRGTKALRAQTTEEFKPEVYRELVPGTTNQYTYNQEIDKFKPNAKRRGQASVGKRDLDIRLKNFAQKERELGTTEQEIEQAIRDRFPLMDQTRISEIMAKPTVAQPTVEEKLATVVQPEGEEKKRGMEKRLGDLDENTYNKIVDESKTYFSQPNKQTEKAAEEFMKGKSLEYMAEFVTSNPNIPGAVNVWMAAMTAKKLGAEIEAAKKAGDVNKVEMLSTARANIYNHFSAKATELGQTVQAFVSFKEDPAANQFIFNKILKQLEEKGVTGLSDAQKVEIKALLDGVSNAAAGLPKDIAITKLSHYLGKLTPISAFDIMQAMWYAKILSGITTQSKNFFANMINTFVEVPVVAMRMSVQTGSLQPIFYAMKGLGGGAIKGLVKAGDILKSGVTSKAEDKFFNNDNLLEYFTWSDTKLGKGLGGAVGKILDFPLFFETSPRALKFIGRSLTASDALFSSANQEAVANMLAFAQAKEEGLKGNVYNRVQQILNNTKQSVADAKAQATQEGFKPGTVQYKRRVVEIVNQNRGEEIVAKAEEMGKRATLTNEPEGFTRGIYLMATKVQETMPISKVMIPFTRIVANVSEMMINFSPAGTYRAITGIKNPKFSFKFTPSGDNKLTNDQRADLFIKSMIGITTLTLLASKTGDEEDDWFDITAGGPSDFAKKYELMKGGWRPYTITFKDGTKVNYAEWPIAGALSAIGTVHDTNRYGNVEDPDWIDKMIIGAYGFATSIYDKSLLKGVSDFVDIFRPSGKYGAGSDEFIKRTAENATKFGAQQAKALTLSNFSQQVLKLTDEYKDNPIKEAKGAEVFYRDIPIINDGLNPIVDVFGDPVTYATTERLLPWMSVGDERKDQLISYLNRNNVFVGMAKEKSMIDINTGEERKMTRQELYEYRKLSGMYTKELLYNNIEFLKEINSMENGKQLMKKAVADITSDARDMAYSELINK